MNRLLAVSWEMPPMYGPRATQVSRTLGELARLGWRPMAVCLAPRRGGPHWPNGAAVNVPSGVELVRVPSPEEWMAVRAAWRVAPAPRDFPHATRVWVPRATQAAAPATVGGGRPRVPTFARRGAEPLPRFPGRRQPQLPSPTDFTAPSAGT